MAKILWLNWSGGGNLPPSLGIARVLTDRGHKPLLPGRTEAITFSGLQPPSQLETLDDLPAQAAHCAARIRGACDFALFDKTGDSQRQSQP